MGKPVATANGTDVAGGSTAARHPSSKTLAEAQEKPPTDPDEYIKWLRRQQRSPRRHAQRSGLVSLDQVQPRKTRWLWEDRIPAGMLTMIDGDPGVGKSTLALEMAARVTAGKKWPDGKRCPRGRVLVMTAEEALAQTVRPRVELAGGNLADVLVLQGIPAPDGAPLRLPSIPADLPYIGEVIKDERIKLLIIDVLASYLGGDGPKINSHQDTDVRRALYPLSVMAERTGCAVIALRHLNKAADLKNAIYRGGGSIGITGQARAVHLAAHDPDDPCGNRRILCPVKLNVGPNPSAIGYTLVPDEETGCARVEWIGESQHTASDLLSAHLDADERQERDHAARWLQEYLSQYADGAAPRPEIVAAGRKAGYYEETLKRACKRAHVTSIRKGWGGGSIWKLDPEVLASMREEQGVADLHSGHSGHSPEADPNDLNEAPESAGTGQE